MNHDFEAQLKQALRPRRPSPGFAGRVAARAAPPLRRRVSPRWLAAAAALVITLAGGLLEHRRRQNMAERAGRELLTALEITAGKLELIRNRLEQ